MRTAYLDIIRDCNLRCVFCSQGDRKGKISLLDLKKSIDRFCREEFGKVIITGGEPLLHPDLVSIVKYAVSKNIDVAVQTNGILITTKLVSDLKTAGLDQLIFSIHSDQSELEDKIMCGNGVLEKQLSGLKIANQSGLITPVSTTIVRKNTQTLYKFFEFMIKNFNFVNHYTLNFVDAVGRSSKNSKVVPKFSEIELELHRSLHLLKTSGKTFRVERVPICYMLDFAEYNTELRRIVSNETALLIRENECMMFTKRYFENVYTKLKSCETCRLTSICPGVNKNYLKIHGPSEFYPIFMDPKKIMAKAGWD